MDSFDLGDVDLSNCDREPIHQLGHVQPFSYLLAFTSDWLLARASVNIERLFNQPVDALIGMPIAELLGDYGSHHVRNMLSGVMAEAFVERSFDRALLKGGLAPNHDESHFDCAVHYSGRMVIVELEDSQASKAGEPASIVRSMMSKLDAAADLNQFLDRGAKMVRQITGFDRVMVYRFAEDDHGEVIAESAAPGLETFLGLHYPASDIPKQARELYLKNSFRIIADTASEPVPLCPESDERRDPLNLSLSIGRAVSPIHIEYLRNMGVSASMSVSIIVNGRLWGLFACHHYSPRLPSFRERTLAELLNQMFSLKLESRLRAQLLEREQAAHAAGDTLIAAIATDGDKLSDAEFLADAFAKMMDFDGIAVLFDGVVSKDGKTPPDEDIRALASRLNGRPSNDVVVENSLAELLPSAATYAETAAGMLAISISRKPRDYVMLFRKQMAQTIKWAGDPNKPVKSGPHGARLNPRSSFEAFMEEVEGHSLAFGETDRHLASALRDMLIEVVLRITEEARENSRRYGERQELLVAELNHRVRNILALIRGIVRQSKGVAKSADEYIDLLQGRIEAMARAHDQITQDNWSSAPLRNLIETEAKAYLDEKAARVTISGVDALLSPVAFSTLALVMHELTTNSAKYGSLSDSGRVDVAISVNRDGDLDILWTESGGPPVKPPKRRGFGTAILDRTVPHDLGGSAELAFKLSGLEARFTIPARHMEALPDDEAAQSPDGSSTREEQSVEKAGAMPKNVLVVEDNLIVAMDCEEMLLGNGIEHVEVAAMADQALAYLDQNCPDFALLDFNLGASSSTPIAERLKQMDIPFCFVTGYGDELELPEALSDVPILQKPFDNEKLLSLLLSLVGTDD